MLLCEKGFEKLKMSVVAAVPFSVCSVWNYQTFASLLAGRLQSCLDLETFRTVVPVQ